MTKQPEALRLAEWIEDDMTCQGDDEIAAELRRLHEVNTELLAELKKLRRAYVSLLETGRDRIIQYGGQCDSVESMEAADPNLKSACAAIAKATGEQA